MWGMSLGLSGLQFSSLENKEVSWIGSGFQTRLNVRIMWVLCQSGSLVNYHHLSDWGVVSRIGPQIL